ncbi:MAG: peroxidase-related enzyme [Thermoleophilia bacterium]
MARVEYVDEASSGEVVQTAFERMRAKRGKVTNIYRALAHKPTMLSTIGPFVAAVQAPDEIDAQMKERIILRVSMINHSAYCTHAHRQIMARMDFSEAEIDEMADPAAADLDAPTRAALTYAEELTRSPGEVAPATFDALRAHFSESQIVEITMLAALYNMVNRFNAGLELDLEEY